VALWLWKYHRSCWEQWRLHGRNIQRRMADFLQNDVATGARFILHKKGDTDKHALLERMILAHRLKMSPPTSTRGPYPHLVMVLRCLSPEGYHQQFCFLLYTTRLHVRITCYTGEIRKKFISDSCPVEMLIYWSGNETAVSLLIASSHKPHVPSTQIHADQSPLIENQVVSEKPVQRASNFKGKSLCIGRLGLYKASRLPLQSIDRLRHISNPA
jgi:hypothetical protein